MRRRREFSVLGCVLASWSRKSPPNGSFGAARPMAVGVAHELGNDVSVAHRAPVEVDQLSELPVDVDLFEVCLGLSPLRVTFVILIWPLEELLSP